MDELVGALLPGTLDDDDGTWSEVAETMGLAASSGSSWNDGETRPELLGRRRAPVVDGDGAPVVPRPREDDERLGATRRGGR